ncbi:MAG: isoquinoline 1-oxidoreductase subunit beta, partial [Variibacter sp.]|nr:isoquinoline 1-oxidoreductase subunit beta [Variibacter sp.]
MAGSELSRRGFLAVAAFAGGALTLGFGRALSATSESAPAGAELTAWIVIHANEAVTIRIARAEMGQGSSTGLAMLVAEELECDWAKVSTETVEPHENARRGHPWGDMSTGGSRSIQASEASLRRAGATARQMLIAAAAARWNVPVSECAARKGVVAHGPSGRTLTYAGLAEAAALVPPQSDVPLKRPDQWT